MPTEKPSPWSDPALKLPIILGVLGILILLWGFWDVARGMSSANWETTPGMVSGATVQHGGPMMGNRWTGSVRLMYEAGGAVRGSSKVTAMGRKVFANQTSAEQWARTMAPSTKVPVAVNPAWPGDGILEPGLGPILPYLWPRFAWGAGLIFLGFLLTLAVSPKVARAVLAS